MNGILAGLVELHNHDPRENPVLTAVLLAGMAALCVVWVILRWRAVGEVGRRAGAALGTK